MATTAHEPEGRGRYLLLNLHAQGGIGQVWLARDPEIGRDVALKELRPERQGHAAAQARFLEEARVTGQLEHPGIVPVHELVRAADGRTFYTMRLVRGRTLGEAIREYHRKRQAGTAGPLELRGLLTAFVAVCQAVAFAHSRQVIHRDLKPANVVLGDYGEVVVLDWGLAKVLGATEEGPTELLPVSLEPGERDETAQGQVLGTPAYMAPEQAEGRVDLVGAATDVYGLGAVLYEVLTGHPPFAGPTDEVVRRVVREEPARPRQVVAEAPAALEAVCLKALAKSPADRYGSAGELAKEVERWLADEPVAAYRDPLTTRLTRWGRRHRTLAATAAAALVAALVGLGAVLAVQARANAQLAAANRRVEQRYALAVEAVKTFHTGVSEDFLLKQDQFKPLRDRLLRSAADFYGRLGSLLGEEADPASRRGLAQANFELAELTAKVGRAEDALATHRAVLARREALAADPAAGPEAQVDVGRSLTAVASLLDATGKGDDAEATFRQAESLLDGLARSSPMAVAPAARAALADCRSRLGRLLEMRGRVADALAAYRLAREEQQAAADAPSSPAAARRDLADTLSALGQLLQRSGRLADAEVEYRAALKLYQALADENPNVAEYRSRLADTRHWFSVNLARQGRSKETIAEMRASMALYRGLAAEYPAVTEYRLQLAHGHYTLAHYLCDDLGRPADGEAEFRAGAGICRKLIAEHPTVTKYRSLLSGTLANLGSLLRRTGQASKAEPVCREAVAVARALADEHPADPVSRGDLAFACVPLGEVLLETGRPAEAGKVLREALQILQKLADENPTSTFLSAFQAWCVSRLAKVQWQEGRAGEAVASLRKAIDIHGRHGSSSDTPSPLTSYCSGCYHALLAGLAADPGSGLTAAEGRAAADRAMEHLRKAVAGGQRNPADYRSASDLKALRDRDDFRRLLKEVEKPVEPSAP
jgi:serine/threonine-protein kinase